MHLLQTFNEENVPIEESTLFTVRISVRTVLVDNNGRVAMLYSRTLDYYTLPGGGVDKGENLSEAAIRECKEETGYTVEIIREIGTTEEIQKENMLVNRATCFLVRAVGEKQEPNFMEDEIGEDFIIKWMSVDDAKKCITNEISLNRKLYHRYISQRVLTFLSEAFPES